jgi:ABC-2 type transport system permease protein
MTATLLRKLLRDLRWALLVTALLLGAFQVLWAKVVERIVGEFTPVFEQLARSGGTDLPTLRNQVIFAGPAGKAIRTLIGGERVNLDNARDLLSIGYVHPLMVVIFCIWAVGRAAGALAGELDRGTMELLLAQPLPRWRLLLAHFLVDLITIPALCLSLWAGNAVGAALIGPEIQLKPPTLTGPKNGAAADERPWVDVAALPLGPVRAALQVRPQVEDAVRLAKGGDRLRVDAAAFGPALWVVGGLMFAVCGYTMWLSSLGRFRTRVLGAAVLVTLLMFLINLIGQMWDAAEPLRPFTIFYYYQPQQVIQGSGWLVPLGAGPHAPAVSMLAVLYGVGVAGYGLALWTFTRRDLPAPL